MRGYFYWLVIFVIGGLIILLFCGCSIAQQREMKSKVVEQTVGDTKTITTHLVETTEITASPDLPDLNGGGEGGIGGLLAALIPGGGGILLALWQFVKALKFKKIAEVQTEAIAEKDTSGTIKTEVASKAAHRGISADVHRFVKKVENGG